MLLSTKILITKNSLKITLLPIVWSAGKGYMSPNSWSPPTSFKRVSGFLNLSLSLRCGNLLLMCSYLQVRHPTKPCLAIQLSNFTRSPNKRAHCETPNFTSTFKSVALRNGPTAFPLIRSIYFQALSGCHCAAYLQSTVCTKAYVIKIINQINQK